MILFEKKYQTFDTVFHHQMKHLEDRQKYSAARRIFNSLLGVSSGDETLRLMFDIFLPTIRLVQSILKRKFPSVDKPLQKQAPEKGPLKNISPRAYFRNFTVFVNDRLASCFDSHSSLASSQENLKLNSGQLLFTSLLSATLG